MFKAAHVGEDHGGVVFIAGLHRVGVAQRAAGLHNRFDALFEQHVNSIAEREERIRRGNAVVLIPTFNDPNDYVALGILRELFPDRGVVGVNAVDLIWGLGAFHCLSHEQPAI